MTSFTLPPDNRQAGDPGHLDDHTNIARALASKTGVHGVAGDVVGTSDAQTLSNKTMDGCQAVADPTTGLGLATKQYVDDRLVSWVNVKDFGAVGNGLTDDTSAIIDAIEATAITTGTYLLGGTEFSQRLALWFPAGWYKVTSPIVLPNYVMLFGDGYWNTGIIQGTADADTVQINPGGYPGTGNLTRVDSGCGVTSGSNVVTDSSITDADLGHTVTGTGIPAFTYITEVTSGVSFKLSANATTTATVSLTVSLYDDQKIGATIKNISIFGKGQGVGAGVGLKIVSVPYCRLDGVRVALTGSHAMSIKYSWKLIFNDCLFTNAGGNGVDLRNQVNCAKFDSCSFTNNSDCGVYLSTGAVVTIDNGDIESNGNHGINAPYSFALAVRGSDFENNNVNDSGSTNLFLGNNVGLGGPTITNNNISGGGKTVNNIVVDTAYNAVIMGNEFTSAPKSGADIQINSGATGTFLGPNTSVSSNMVTDNGVSTSRAGKRFVPGAFALTDASSIAVDASKGNTFRVTLAGNRTLATPTQPVDGQEITFEITQDATGSRTLAFESAYAFSSDIPAPTLSTAAGKCDVISFKYNAAVSKWRCVGVVIGF